MITSSWESPVTTRNHLVQLWVSFYGFSQFQIGFSWFQVGFYAFSRFQVGFSRSQADFSRCSLKTWLTVDNHLSQSHPSTYSMKTTSHALRWTKMNWDVRKSNKMIWDHLRPSMTTDQFHPVQSITAKYSTEIKDRTTETEIEGMTKRRNDRKSENPCREAWRIKWTILKMGIWKWIATNDPTNYIWRLHFNESQQI